MFCSWERRCDDISKIPFLRDVDKDVPCICGRIFPNLWYVLCEVYHGIAFTLPWPVDMAMVHCWKEGIRLSGRYFYAGP